MDNLSAHKQPAVEAAIRAVGATIIFTPPYSPDFNPNENFFLKLKAYLRKVQARIKSDLDAAIVACCATLTRKECNNFFLHCGYGVTYQGTALGPELAGVARDELRHDRLQLGVRILAADLVEQDGLGDLTGPLDVENALQLAVVVIVREEIVFIED